MAPTHGVLPPHKPDNEVVRLDLAGLGFLCLLRQLLLQDSVVLRKQFPSNINRKCYSKLCFSGNCKIQAAKTWLQQHT